MSCRLYIFVNWDMSLTKKILHIHKTVNLLNRVKKYGNGRCKTFFMSDKLDYCKIHSQNTTYVDISYPTDGEVVHKTIHRLCISMVNLRIIHKQKQS